MLPPEKSSVRRICLFISTEMHLGGGEKSMLTVLEGKETAGFEPVLLCRPKAEVGTAARESGVRVVEVEMVQRDLARQPFAYLRSLLRAFRIVLKIRPAILCGDGWRGVPYAVPMAKLLRRPAFIFLREMDLPPSSVTRFLTKQADHVTTISKAQRRFLMEAGIINDDNSRLIYNGLPMSYLREGNPPEALRVSVGLQSEQLGVVLPGYLSRYKGNLIFVEAVKQITDQIPKARFYFLGGPFPNVSNPEDVGFDKVLAEKVSEEGLSDVIKFLGHRDNVADVLWAMDLVVVPSIHEEAFGRVAVEAMLAGKAVIVSQSGGLPEVIQDGKTGIVVPKNDPTALAEAMLKLLEDDTLRNAFGKAGQERAQRLFPDTLKRDKMWAAIAEVCHQ
ncbi:glycosyltransferase [Rubellicoccus peritrichatus]|uniref:Glycosyltransferase n=1 Tax=Rubellicoccus peritrichatus TaxID=3080537 RepID=A0AAQ3QX51_9BACT|nr:glycosyltransferase [Puniceicoccus sp. CR14]WOO42525.1 glycosyltransferase [Puniceicoccus sp. CR14]